MKLEIGKGAASTFTNSEPKWLHYSDFEEHCPPLLVRATPGIPHPRLDIDRLDTSICEEVDRSNQLVGSIW